MNKGLILGFFDGVHLGHQEVIKSALDYADNAVLITFKNSPAEYFSGNYEYIFSRKKSFSRIQGVEVVELDFREIATMPAEKYLENLINEFHPVSISTGFNHTFGFNKSGDTKLLEACQTKYGYKYFCVPAQMYKNKPISSTRIKSCLKAGDVENANTMLGTPFSLEGEVIHGAKIGRTIGFPTANIMYPEHIVKLPFGVYGGKVRISPHPNTVFHPTSLLPIQGGRLFKSDSGTHPGKEDQSKFTYTAILNWGMKPTVNNTKEPVIEIHIPGFEGDLYGQNIEVEILKKIRDEKKFESLEELKTQIKKDTEECLKL